MKNGHGRKRKTQGKLRWLLAWILFGAKKWKVDLGILKFEIWFNLGMLYYLWFKLYNSTKNLNLSDSAMQGKSSK